MPLWEEILNPPGLFDQPPTPYDYVPDYRGDTDWGQVGSNVGQFAAEATVPQTLLNAEMMARGMDPDTFEKLIAAAELGGSAIGLGGLAYAGGKLGKGDRAIGRGLLDLGKVDRSGDAVVDALTGSNPFSRMAGDPNNSLLGLLGDEVGAVPTGPAGVKVLEELQQQMQLPKAERTQPSGYEVFETTPEAYQRTTDVVPQDASAFKYPAPVEGGPLPLKGRSQGIIDQADEIAQIYAGKMEPFVGKNVEHFYHTGPMHEGLGGLLKSQDEATGAMDRFSRLYAATSPRTPTDANIRSAALLGYKDANDIPFNQTVLDTGTANDIGVPMMDMHRDLATKMLRGDDIWGTNPKPSSFQQNTFGNLQGVTADTHNIRGVLLSRDELKPGSLERQWFNSDANYELYKKDGLTPELLAGGINDSLGTQMQAGKKMQAEYGPIADITERAARHLGVDPAPGQSLGWFGLGDQTNLRSAPATLTELMNQRLDVTGQHLGMDPEEVAKMWATGLPLM